MSNGFENYLRPRPEIGGYDVAQICLNGHVVNNSSISHPAHNADYCPDCGKKTITECPKCTAKIRGDYRVSGLSSFGESPAPAFCYKCGARYPWTESSLSAAREYMREVGRLDANELGIWERSLNDLVSETPRTQVAALRFKTLTAKAGPVAMEGVKRILIEVMAETAKKAIWG